MFARIIKSGHKPPGIGYVTNSHSLFSFYGQEAFQNLLNKREGDRAEWEYPFAVAGINISFMLVQMLGIQSGKKLMSNSWFR